MENEIKVGEYVRTKEGYIAKCIEVDEDGDYYTFDNYVEVQYGDKFYSLYDDELKNIVKHSPNLKDLIQKDDFVNKCRVYEVEEKGITVYQKVENSATDYNWISFDEIQEIVTKEMMEYISYKITKM